MQKIVQSILGFFKRIFFRQKTVSKQPMVKRFNSVELTPLNKE